MCVCLCVCFFQKRPKPAKSSNQLHFLLRWKTNSSIYHCHMNPSLSYCNAWAHTHKDTHIHCIPSFSPNGNNHVHIFFFSYRLIIPPTGNHTLIWFSLFSLTHMHACTHSAEYCQVAEHTAAIGSQMFEQWAAPLNGRTRKNRVELYLAWRNKFIALLPVAQA